MLVLREAFFGVRRFDDFARVLGCGRAVLTARLNTLADHQVLARVPYQEPGERIRSEYKLTAKGRELFPALLALLQWGDRWTADAAGPAIVLAHTGCGESVSVTIGCAAGHEQLSVLDLEAKPGPGAKRLDTER